MISPKKQRVYQQGSKDWGLAHLDTNDIIDTKHIVKQDYMQHLSPQEQYKVTVKENYENLMNYRRQLIDEQFRPLDLYYTEQKQRFDSNDIDLIDKSERYMEERITGAFAKKMARYDTSQETIKLIKFVEWATKRGGDAFNQSKKNKTQGQADQDNELRKPFWTRTYVIGKREFRFERKFINEYMKRVDVFVKDNGQAYHDYKRRALFPKISDTTQAFQQAKGDDGEGIGFIEYQEAQICELYNIFSTVCR